MELSKNTFKRAILSLVSGYASALLFLVVAGSLMLKTNEPDRLSLAVSIAAIMIGALVLGLVSRASGSTAPEAVVSGLVYGTVLFVLSAILGGNSPLSLPVRALIFLVPAVISAVVSVLPSSFSHKHKSRASGAAVNRYINSRT